MNNPGFEKAAPKLGYFQTTLSLLLGAIFLKKNKPKSGFKPKKVGTFVAGREIIQHYSLQNKTHYT
jgi:hypothetical protein